MRPQRGRFRYPSMKSTGTRLRKMIFRARSCNFARFFLLEGGRGKLNPKNPANKPVDSMQTPFPTEEIFLALVKSKPQRSNRYPTELVLAAGAALFWTIALPLASLILIAAALGRRIGELTRRISKFGRGIGSFPEPPYRFIDLRPQRLGRHLLTRGRFFQW